MEPSRTSGARYHKVTICESSHWGQIELVRSSHWGQPELVRSSHWTNSNRKEQSLATCTAADNVFRSVSFPATRPQPQNGKGVNVAGKNTPLKLSVPHHTPAGIEYGGKQLQKHPWQYNTETNVAMNNVLRNSVLRAATLSGLDTHPKHLHNGPTTSPRVCSF